MAYYFIFCKSDILLQRNDDGTYTIPLSDIPPLGVKPWTHIMKVGNMDDGISSEAYYIDNPVTDDPHYEMCGLRQSFYKIGRAHV